MVSKHHIHHAIHHKLTSNLPRIFTTNSRNPLKNAHKTALSEAPTTPEKNIDFD